MTESMTSARTVVGLFEAVADANRAVDALIEAGFGRDEIGVITGHELSNPENHVNAVEDDGKKMISAVEKGLGFGAGLGAIAGGVSSLLIPGVGPIVIGGALAAAFLGAGLGGAVGGVMAGLMKAGVNESDARLFEAALRHGGVVVTVHTDDVRCRHAVAVLDSSGALDMDTHRDQPGDTGTDDIQGATDTRANDTHRDHSGSHDTQSSGVANEAMALDENAKRLEPWAKHGAILGAHIDPDTFEEDYRQDYQNKYAGTGLGYDRYEPAYRFGQQYARDATFLDRDWYSSEDEMRNHWESGSHGGAWADFKDAVRHGWDRVRGQR